MQLSLTLVRRNPSHDRWGKGFRAPSISESGDSGIAFGQGNVNDPVLCPANPATGLQGTYNALCSYPVTGISPSNPNLKAVTSQNSTVGVIFEPTRSFNVSVDWYYIAVPDRHRDESERRASGLTSPRRAGCVK